jgi:hypothetical protein
MKRADEVRAEHKGDAITHYLLKAFPGAAIVSQRGHRGGWAARPSRGRFVPPIKTPRSPATPMPHPPSWYVLLVMADVASATASMAVAHRLSRRPRRIEIS